MTTERRLIRAAGVMGMVWLVAFVAVLVFLGWAAGGAYALASAIEWLTMVCLMGAADERRSRS